MCDDVRTMYNVHVRCAMMYIAPTDIDVTRPAQVHPPLPATSLPGVSCVGLAANYAHAGSSGRHQRLHARRQGADVYTQRALPCVARYSVPTGFRTVVRDTCCLLGCCLSRTVLTWLQGH
jgi:hypothetical protein